jgi:hypothetical protein
MMMPKFIIRTNTGYGNNYQVIEAVDMAAAEHVAYDMWREECENNSDYEAMEYNAENCSDYDFNYEPEA